MPRRPDAAAARSCRCPRRPAPRARGSARCERRRAARRGSGTPSRARSDRLATGSIRGEPTVDARDATARKARRAIVPTLPIRYLSADLSASLTEAAGTPRAELLGEELRLFPGGEVAALVDFVEVDEVGVGLLRPAARRLILLAGKDGRGNRDGHALRVEEATLVLPIEARRGDARVGEPIERDVVEDLVTRQFAGGARGPVQRRR